MVWIVRQPIRGYQEAVRERFVQIGSGMLSTGVIEEQMRQKILGGALL